MKLYLGILPIDLQRKYNSDLKRILVSYYVFKTKYASLKDKIESYDVFVDSGAFSAYFRKITLDVHRYIDFIKENNIKNYASLDVIYDPQATWKNFEIMLQEGLSPIPTFHYQTDIKELKKYKKYPYIALGGLVPLARQKKKLTEWLDYCFKYLIDDIYNNGLKVHGFGVMSQDILERYPFYSVDSTSWSIGLKFGAMYKKTAAHKKPLRENSEFAEHLRREKDLEFLSKRNITSYNDMETFITNLWSERGFNFKD